jgi:TatD DNase family protein
LPVILHTRRALDEVLAALRRQPVRGGIAHAFNGSTQQASQLLTLGLRLGFGGTLTFERSRRIRELARTLPPQALVLETDAPDIAPQWMQRSAAERAAGASSRNTPAELPRIGATLAQLRGWTLEETASVTRANTLAALPRLAALPAVPDA